MKVGKLMRYQKIIALLLAVGLLLFSPVQVCFAVLSAQEGQSSAETQHQNELLQEAPLGQGTTSAAIEHTSPGAIYQEVQSEETTTPVAIISTFEELTAYLEEYEYIGGEARVTNDLVLPKGTCFEYITPALVTIDMGEHTLYVDGELLLSSHPEGEGLTLMGKGGEHGLIHVRTGGVLNLWHVTLQSETGTAVWQEEGAIFDFLEGKETKGIIHFAQKPVANSFSHSAPWVAIHNTVVLDEQSLKELLPETDEARIIFQGEVYFDYLPVEWDLEPYDAQLTAKESVFITGSYPDEYTAFGAPTAFVNFQNGYPAVFAYCEGMLFADIPFVRGHIYLIDPELPYRFEWSQDGKVWQPAVLNRTYLNGNLLEFAVVCPQEIQPVYPYYVSMVVDYPDGSEGYSNVLTVYGADRVSDSGGGRGGETNPIEPELPPITSPPPTNPPPPIDPPPSNDTGDSEEESPWQEKPPVPKAPPSTVPLPIQVPPASPQNPQPSRGEQAPPSHEEQDKPSNGEDVAKLPPQALPPDSPPQAPTDPPPTIEAAAIPEANSTKAKETALAVTAIAVIGAPIYIAPLRKLLLQLVKKIRF